MSYKEHVCASIGVRRIANTIALKTSRQKAQTALASNMDGNKCMAHGRAGTAHIRRTWLHSPRRSSAVLPLPSHQRHLGLGGAHLVARGERCTLARAMANARAARLTYTKRTSVAITSNHPTLEACPAVRPCSAELIHVRIGQPRPGTPEPPIGGGASLASPKVRATRWRQAAATLPLFRPCQH